MLDASAFTRQTASNFAEGVCPSPEPASNYLKDNEFANSTNREKIKKVLIQIFCNTCFIFYFHETENDALILVIRFIDLKKNF